MKEHYKGIESLSNDDEAYNLWLLLVMTHRTIFKAREKELNKYGITPEQAGTLYAIKKIGKNITPAEISRQTFREAHTCSALINRMEKNGLVKKVKNLNKKNMINILLTKKGEQAYSLSVKRESIHYMMTFLSKEEQSQLILYLRELQDGALKWLFPPPPQEFRQNKLLNTDKLQ